MPRWRCADGSACLRSGRSWSWPGGPPRRGFPADLRRCVVARDVRPGGLRLLSFCRLPTGLGDAGQLTAVGHGPETDPAQPEPPVHGPGAPAPRAPGVPAHLELRRAVRLGDQGLLRHCQLSLNGNPSRRSSERPSSSLVAVVTTVTSIPRWRSTWSGLISWNMSCSVRPNV